MVVSGNIPFYILAIEDGDNAWISKPYSQRKNYIYIKININCINILNCPVKDELQISSLDCKYF